MNAQVAITLTENPRFILAVPWVIYLGSMEALRKFEKGRLAINLDKGISRSY